MSEKTIATEVVLNDAKPFIINNIENQAKCLRDNGHCSIILLSGPPGIGKSDIMEQVASELGMGLNPQYLGTMLVEQFGMPLPTMEENAKFQKWSDPDFYSTENLRVQPNTTKLSCTGPEAIVEVDGTIILFMDDIHLATKTIQTYFFQLLTYRSIHNKKMPDNFVMVGAGNRSVDRAGAQPIMAPIVNRFYIIDVVATADDWIKNFAIPAEIRQDIVSFIELYPELLQSEPLESKPWASPRSWTYLAQEMTQKETNGPLDILDIVTMGKGHIGVDYTTKFIEYVQLFMKWDAAGMLAGIPVPETGSKIESYSLMSALVAELLKDLRQSKWNIADEGMVKKIEILKTFFTGLIDTCPQIVPLGLRSVLFGEKITSDKAALFYQLTKGDEKLVDAVRQITSNK